MAAARVPAARGLAAHESRPIVWVGTGRGRVEERGYLVDNSVLQKLSRSRNIRDRFHEIIEAYPVYTCAPQVLEYCWSARNPAEYAELREDVELFTPAVEAPTQRFVLDIQQALWEGGMMRAAGNTDVLIAATAITNDLTLANCDRDFGYIAGVLPAGVFRQEFIAE
ncbi:MAG: PIN domain-containing protein [Leucobacter sp.]